MLYILKYLLRLIHIDQETILNWFGIENDIDDIYTSIYSNSEQPTTLKLVVEGLLAKLQDGLSLAEIESILIFILFVRFLILIIRYNSKTSFYITCIGLIAGFLWYRHLIDIISLYRIVLTKLPWVHKLGIDAVQLQSVNKQLYYKDVQFLEYAHWYNPFQILYNGFARGVISKQGSLKYYIDPFSMLIAKVPDSMKSYIDPIYYTIYKQGIPKIIGILRKMWNQLSGVAAYALITRVGKRYCPYLIRWHWTFLLVLSMLEQFIGNFIYRCYFFQIDTLLPELKRLAESKSLISESLMSESLMSELLIKESSILFQDKILNGLIAFTVLSHVGLIIFGLLHAIWGQYFYIPFIVENVELHIGSRPTDSIYSGGGTAWQDPEEKEKKLHKKLPKLWYGWFGRGTIGNFNIFTLFKKIIELIIELIKEIFWRLINIF